MKSLANISMKVLGCISLMSAPAAKAFSPPASRMQPMPSSASRSSTAAAISRNTPNDSALSILGRLSVIMPTAPLLSTMMCSNVLMIHPASWLAGNLPAGGIGFKGGGALVWTPRFAGVPRDCGTRALSGHEHAGGRGHGPKSAEGDEDLSDQGRLVPTGAMVAADRNRRNLRNRLGRRVGRRRRLLALLQRPIDLVELIGGDELGPAGRQYDRGIVGRRLQNFTGPRRHRLGAVGQRVGGHHFCVGVGDRRRDRSLNLAVVGRVGFSVAREFQRQMAGFAMGVDFSMTRAMPGVFVGCDRRGCRTVRFQTGSRVVGNRRRLR